MAGDPGSRRAVRRTPPVARLLAVLLIAGAAAALPAGPARSAAPRIEAGSALATAQVLTAKITYGGLSLPVTVASSGASYRDTSAQATSQGISAATLASAATGGGCTTGAGAPTPLAAPPLAPVEASTTDQATEHRSTGALPIGAGEVDARRSPLSATSTTSAIALAVPALLKVSGSSTASVSYDNGTARNASAAVSVDVALANGLVTLSGLTWELSQRGTTDRQIEGRFALVAIKVASTTFRIGTTEQLKGAVTAANAALKVLGIAIDVPELGRTEDAATIAPLNIRIFGTSTLAAVIRPLMALKAPVQDLLADVLAGDPCGIGQLATLVGVTTLMADVVLSALSGEGTIELGIGGVQVATAPPPRYQDPFAGGPPTSSGTPPHATGPAPQTPAGAPAAPGAAAPPAAAVPAAAAAVPAQGAPAAYRVGCVSLNPTDHGPCSRGADPRLAALLLLAGLALFGADLAQSRRRPPIVRRSLR